LLHERFSTPVFAHLSAESNRPSFAQDVVVALRKADLEGALTAADQKEPTGWFDLERRRLGAGPSQLPLL